VKGTNNPNKTYHHSRYCGNGMPGKLPPPLPSYVHVLALYT
jgi:hypothetical protein